MEKTLDKQKYNISVDVTPKFINGAVEYGTKKYLFAYMVIITNRGTVTATLKSREWLITDSYENQQRVSGEGVVGKQPLLHPGEMFCYASGAVLDTPYGVMEGTYSMLAEDGTAFSTPISPFVLKAPTTIH